MTTSEFLSFFPGFRYQTLDDKAMKGAVPKREALKHLVTFDQMKEYFDYELLRKNAWGAGIFFTPNNFAHARRRQANQCEGVNAWFAEADGKSKRDQWKVATRLPLQPSFIVETANSLHLYWLARNATKGRFRDIQTSLIYHIGGDNANKDLSRVFRVPGYNHNKREPFLVRIVHAAPSNRYTEGQMIASFPIIEDTYVKKKIKYPKIQPGVTSKGCQDPLWDGMGKMDNRNMLEILSGSGMVSGEVFTFRDRPGGGYYIDVDGGPADAWIDQNGMIGSGKCAGPTWVQWLGYYGHSKGAIAQWYKDRFNIK